MKRQTRPFAIETKTSRKPPLLPRGTSRPQNDWIDPFPEDVPERDIHEDVVLDDKSEALRQAERLFARVSEPARQRFDGAVFSQMPVAPGTISATPPQAESRTPRILPDLLAQARADERQAQEQVKLEQALHQPVPKRSRAVAKPKRTKQVRAPISDELPLESPPEPQATPMMSPLVVVHPSPTIDRASANRSDRRSGELPLGQRWKERRLPRVCWDQPGLRKRQRG